MEAKSRNQKGIWNCWPCFCPVPDFLTNNYPYLNQGGLDNKFDALKMNAHLNIIISYYYVQWWPLVSIIISYYSWPVVTFRIQLLELLLHIICAGGDRYNRHDSSLTPMVTLQKSDLGRGPRFSVADPGVRYRGPLLSPILTNQALGFWCVLPDPEHSGFIQTDKNYELWVEFHFECAFWI